jgi:hypothetical protein
MKLVKKGKQEKEIEEKLPCMENIIRWKVAQVIEHLLSMRKALGSIQSTIKKKSKRVANSSYMLKGQ